LIALLCWLLTSDPKKKVVVVRRRLKNQTMKKIWFDYF